MKAKAISGDSEAIQNDLIFATIKVSTRSEKRESNEVPEKYLPSDLKKITLCKEKCHSGIKKNEVLIHIVS